MIPRFGATYERTIAESVDVKKVLNNASTGVGHYASTEPLGAVGNFAVAGHRTTFGAPFGRIDELRVGDRIYIETKKGWYVYRFRNMEYVYPSASDVLNEVPRETIVAKDRILTMTSCHPKLSAAERFIAYSIFESFVPRGKGAPSEVADMRRSG
jgi:sortase A